jgi:hypothetical protein
MRIRAAVVIVAVGATLAACGGSDNKTDAGSLLDQTPAPVVSDTDTGDVTGGTNLTSDDCIAASAAIAAAAGGAAALAGAGLPDSEEAQAELARIAANVPEDLKDEFDALGEALGKFYAALADADINLQDPSSISNPANAAELAKIGQKFSTEVAPAVKTIQTRLDELCKNK